jgi:HEAT repeat protein
MKKCFLLIFFLAFSLVACEQADIDKAMEYQQKGIYNKAIDNYLALIKKGKKVAQAQKNLGDIYLEMGRNKEAFDCFKASLEITYGFALDEVIALTSSGNKEIRELAIKILTEIRNEDTKRVIFEKLLNKLKSDEFHDKVDALEAVFAFSKNASVITDDILTAFDTEKPVVQNKILSNLFKIADKDNSQKIIDKLESIAQNKDENMLTRVTAVDCIANMKSKNSLTKLIELTKENSSIAASAKTAIEKIGLPSRELVGNFVPLLSDEQPSSVKLLVLKIFSDMKAEANDAVANIIPLLKDKNSKVKETAKAALESIGAASQACIPALIELLDNKDVDIKLRALNEIVEIEAVNQAIDKIRLLQEDPSKEVRKYAQQIVDNLK